MKRPESLAQRDGIVLNLGYADDNVIGYDHPPVLVFRNHGKKSESELRNILLPNVPLGTRGISDGSHSDVHPGTQNLMLTELIQEVSRIFLMPRLLKLVQMAEVVF